MLSAAVLLTWLVAGGQQPQDGGAAAVVDALLFGAQMAPVSQTGALPPAVQPPLDRYRQREQLFRETIPRPQNMDGREGAVYLKRAALERAIFSAYDRPDSLELAESFVTEVRILHEWQGFAASPLAEAASAVDYLSSHPASPVASYVRLFIGHRRLCAIGLEGLEADGNSARRVRTQALAQLTLARESGPPLVRLAAERLLDTRRCEE